MDRERIGKYKIIGELGRGTMGEVYKAHDPVLDRFVALKTLPLKLGPDNETLERFQREARAAALLNHPNIVTVHDFGEERGLLYMAMELLEGIDLRQAIDRKLMGTLDEKLAVMDSVLAGLDFAHARGVVHRDIKPANIHLGKQRQVKIMDFGLARLSTSEMTQEGIVLGTPNYMSPEQALGDKVDGRSDVFSTGAVFYEILTGHKPFEAETTPSVLFQVVHRQPPPIKNWAPDVPLPIVVVVNRALEKDLKQRFGSAGDMRAALSVARNGVAAAGVAAPSRPRAAPPPLPPHASMTIRKADPGTVPPQLRMPALGRSAGGLAPSGAAGSRKASWRALLLGGGLAVALLLAIAIGLWMRTPETAKPHAGPAADELAQELVRKQLRLAQSELDNKNYKAALGEARGVLKLAPGNPDARAIIASAQSRVDALDHSVAEARRLLEAGDDDGASRELQKVLELDAQYPPAAEIAARLNGVFKARADEAKGALAGARQAAQSAGAPPDTVQPGDEAEKKGDAQVARGEFALAAASFIEARDEFERARKGALAARRRAATAPTAPPVTAPTPPPARGFTPDSTRVAGPPGGPAGFDGAQDSRRVLQFSGGIEFEVLPPAVRVGDPFVVRIHLRNDAKKSVKIRTLSIAAVVDGQRTPAAAKPLLKEVPAQSRALVAEYSSVWNGARDWMLEAVVTSDKDEMLTSRLKAN
jgi:eukaryotic-like serine/threonine-protein kinase